MRAVGLVQVYLELAVADDAPDAERQRELAFAHSVLERFAQEIRHRAVDAGLVVDDVRAGLVAPRQRG